MRFLTDLTFLSDLDGSRVGTKKIKSFKKDIISVA